MLAKSSYHSISDNSPGVRQVPSNEKAVETSARNPRLAPFGSLIDPHRIKFLCAVIGIALSLLGHLPRVDAQELAFRDLFNGHDLTGWVDVNTSPETWSVRDGLLVCNGQPIGVMRSDRQYENFILEVEWRHMEPGGNSGIFLWCDAIPQAGRLPRGMEVQMLELDWVNQHKKPDGELPPIAYVHGELFGAGGMTATPENPRGNRSKSVENRCKGVGQWNKYVVVAVDGCVKLSVNGKFVNGIRDASVKKGYLCLESEGKEIHLRNLRIMELPPGLAGPHNTAPLIK